MHEQWPLSWQVAALVALLLLSAFFSIAETAMMAINRYRLKHLVTQGHRSAVRVAELLSAPTGCSAGSSSATRW